MNKDEAYVCACDIVNAIGEKNIVKMEICATRLKFTVKDSGIFVRKKLEEVGGVRGVFESCGRINVVVGTKNVYRVADEIHSITGIDIPEKKESPDDESHESPDDENQECKAGNPDGQTESGVCTGLSGETSECGKKEWIIGEYRPRSPEAAERILFRKMSGTDKEVKRYLMSIVRIGTDGSRVKFDENEDGCFTVSVGLGTRHICVSATAVSSL